MPLILAVEPDRRQASQIGTALCGRPRTELVIAQSAAAALQAIGARVPDLLLTSPLLSRQDEERLAEWLSGLGAAAARVQALTIPILAAARPTKRTRGMLSVLRRRPRTSSPDGCEPAMFADQVGLYLERAHAEPEEAPGPVSPPEPVPVPVPLVAPLTAAEAHAPQPALPERDTAVSHRIDAVFAMAPLPADEETGWVTVALDEVLEELARWPAPADAEISTDSVWMLTPVPEMELVVPPPAEPPDTMTVVLLTPVYDLPSEPVEVTAPPVFEIVTVLDFDVMLPPARHVIPAPPLDVIPAPARDVVGTPPPVTTRRRKAVKPKPKPVQDEWGLFDPSQCGFAALVDKLDEITAGGAASETSDDVTVRVISY